MKRAQVVTPWVGAHTVDDPLRPQVAAVPGMTWRDVTGQADAGLPPTPNLLAVEVVCSDEALAAIEADPTFLVLWSEEL